ncbi:MAG: protein kinase [Myxococcales bacterium]|nr:protein kinase [Myxococcales bacterium]
MSTPRSLRSDPSSGGRAPTGGFEGDDRFELRRLVGEGGMGVVYEAFDRERELIVALKTLRAVDAEALYRLKTEFRARADLEHRNLVRLGELRHADGHWFFTMELVDGVTFLDHVRDPMADPSVTGPPGDDVLPGTFDEARLRESLRQLAQGLDVLHRAGKVHRDLKPSNVLVTRKGRVVVLDFGLVRDAVIAQVTDAAVVGTAAYMAPEQAMTPAVMPAADCYSVGVMLFEALTGRLPFEGRAIEILMRKQQATATPVARFGPVPADLARLCDELLALDPERRPTAADIVARLSTRTARAPDRVAPFVGRAPELAALDAALEDVRGGAARAVCVEGPSGIGKSALVHAFVERLDQRAREIPVLTGRCYERESLPFKGIDGVVDALVRDLLRRDPIDVALLLTPEVDALARTFPVLRRVPAIARLSVRKPDSPIELRARAFRGLRQLLAALASRHPLVVVIDDIQWADSDSLALLGEILEPASAPPILLILTYRRDGGPALALPAPIATLALARLSAAEGRALISLLAPTRAADADALVDEADGHPLFLQELVRHSAGAVARLDEALWGRVTRMELAARRVLEIVAVAGAPVPQGVIGTALAFERPALAKAIDSLRATWLVRTGGTRSHDPIEPYHDRVREAVVARIPAARRRRYHQRLAAALLASPAVEQAPLLVVRHLEAGGALEHAAELAEVSARRASDTLAFELAADLWAAALRMGTHDDDSRRAILAARAEALGYAGRGHAAAQVYLTAADGAEPELAARCRRLAAHELLVSGHVAEGRRLLDEVLASIGEYNPRTIGAAKRWLAWLWFRTLVRGTHFTPRRSPDARSLDQLRLDVYRTASLGLGMVEVIAGGAFQARALLVSLRLGDRRRVTYALAYHAMYLGSSGIRVPLARRAVARAFVLARACASQFLVAWARAAEGIVEFFAGRHAYAIATLCEAEIALRERSVGTAAEINQVRVFIAFALRRHGDYRELAVRQREYLRDANRRGDRYAAASFQWSSNIVWLAADDPARARAELTPEIWSPPEAGLHLQHWFRVRGLFELALYLGDDAGAAEAAAQIRPFAGPAFAHVEAVRTETLYLLARAAIVRGDVAAARAAIRPLGRVRAPYIRAFVRIIVAAIEVLAARPARARALLDGAIADADATDMIAIGALARRRKAQLDGDAAALAAADQILASRGVVATATFAQVFATWPAAR